MIFDLKPRMPRVSSNTPWPTRVPNLERVLMSLNSFIPTSREDQVTPGAQREAELRVDDHRYYSQTLRAAQSAEPLPEDIFQANLITMSAAKFMLNYLKENPTALEENP